MSSQESEPSILDELFSRRRPSEHTCSVYRTMVSAAPSPPPPLRPGRRHRRRQTSHVAMPSFASCESSACEFVSALLSLSPPKWSRANNTCQNNSVPLPLTVAVVILLVSSYGVIAFNPSVPASAFICRRMAPFQLALSSSGDEGSDTAPLFVDMNPRNGDTSAKSIHSATHHDSALKASFHRVKQSIVSGTATIDDDGINGADAIKRINLAIVERGQRFTSPESTSLGDIGIDDGALSCEPQRVPGCVATVHVKTTLIPLNDKYFSFLPSSYRVIVNGDADALLSRGLLALLSDALSGEATVAVNGDDDTAPTLVTAQDILDLEPKLAASMLGLRTVLSTGRNDGLASMTNVIQNQIRQLLQRGREDSVAPDDSTETTYLQSSSKNDSKQRRPTVAMLLSGGVDSSVALNLLVRQNYDVTAFYLKIWLEDELSHLGQCPWEDDYNVCKAVCEQAGVPLETVSLQNEYKDRVISYTVDEARRGRTPNPDIMCNSRVKFGCFYDAIAGRGFDYVASGHYAQLEAVAMEDNEDNGNDSNNQKRMRLLRAPDPVKDQTYFLCALTQEQLSNVKFPIGAYQKSEVRDLAHQFNLPNRNRPDSQGLCFLGKVKFDDFINAYLGTNPGDIVDATSGRIIGRHNGLWYHTVGQRKGIGKVLNPIESSRGPWYIVAKDRERNFVIASNEYDQEAFEEARSDFYVEDITWIAGSPPLRLFAPVVGEKDEESRQRWKDGRFTMKIRHGPTMVNGTLTLSEDEVGGTGGNVHLDTKDKGLAPGQYCVFYNLDDDECLGAGVISERHWARLFSSMEDDAGSMTSADVAVQ